MTQKWRKGKEGDKRDMADWGNMDKHGQGGHRMKQGKQDARTHTTYIHTDTQRETQRAKQRC